MCSIQLQAFGEQHFQREQLQPWRLQYAVQRSPVHSVRLRVSYACGLPVQNAHSRAEQSRTACSSNRAEAGAASWPEEHVADSSTSTLNLKPSPLTICNPLKLLFGTAWKKAVPLSILFFSTTYIFTMLQSMKDGIVVVAMGPEALPFLATLGTLPASLAYFNFYRLVLVPHCPPEHLFIATALPFLAFYALFALVLYPLAPSLQNPDWLAWLPGVLPQGLHGLAAALQHWVYSLFYVVADLWGPVMITLAFWTVADEVCSMSEAAAVYPQLGLLANLGLVGSGRFIKAVHNAVGGDMGAVVKVLVCAMLVMSCVMFACKAVINRSYIKPQKLKGSTRHQPQFMRSSSPQQQQQEEEEQVMNNTRQGSGNPNGSSSTDTTKASSKSKAKHRTSWDEARAVLQRNPKAAALTTWVVSFGVALRLCEFCFKFQLRSAAADSAAYCCALADVNSGVGLATIIMMLSSKLIFKHLGWSGAALISPSVLMVLGTIFFASCLLAQAAVPPPAAAAAGGVGAAATGPVFSSTPSGVSLALQQWMSPSRGADALQALSAVALATGAATNIAAGACRHSLFTPSKEMVYKTMPAGVVKESKAVVDLIGGQVAKSGAGWIVQLLLLACGSISAALPAMAALYLVANLSWLKSTLRMCKDMNQYEQQQTAASKAAARRQQQEQEQLPDAEQQQLMQDQVQQQLVSWHRAWELWQQQQQQQEQQPPLLPLPGELAAAAAAVYGISVKVQLSHGTTSLNTSRAVIAHQPQLTVISDPDTAAGQPVMLQDAAYWDAIYAALAADTSMVESVILGRKAAAAQNQQQQQQQVERWQQQQEPSELLKASMVTAAVAGNGRGDVQQSAQPLPGATRRMPAALSQLQTGGSKSVLKQPESAADLKGAALAKEALHTMFDS